MNFSAYNYLKQNTLFISNESINLLLPIIPFGVDSESITLIVSQFRCRYTSDFQTFSTIE